MKLLPYLHTMPRVDHNILQCLEFVAGHPRGKPKDRAADIWNAISAVLMRPEANPVRAWRPQTGIGLRRCRAAQFVVFYTYLRPTNLSVRGVVSIRAVRHSRVRDVFEGVREPTSEYGACDLRR